MQAWGLSAADCLLATKMPANATKMETTGCKNNDYIWIIVAQTFSQIHNLTYWH